MPRESPGSSSSKSKPAMPILPAFKASVSMASLPALNRVWIVSRASILAAGPRAANAFKFSSQKMSVLRSAITSSTSEAESPASSTHSRAAASPSAFAAAYAASSRARPRALRGEEYQGNWRKKSLNQQMVLTQHRLHQCLSYLSNLLLILLGKRVWGKGRAGRGQ